MLIAVKHKQKSVNFYWIKFNIWGVVDKLFIECDSEINEV